MSSLRILDIADGFSSATAPSSSGSVGIGSTQDIASGGHIALPSGSLSLVKVQGDGAAQTADSTPFSGTPLGGQIMWIEGQSDTNTLTIEHNDAAGGCILNGDAILGQYDILCLVYDNDADRYKELGRNF